MHDWTYTLINLHPNEYTKELDYYPFVANLGRSVGNCNTLNDLSNKVCVPNKTDLNLSGLHDYRNEWIENINKAYIMYM